MRFQKIILALCLLTASVYPSFSQVKQIKKILSPDKETVFELGLQQNGDLKYRMLVAGKEIIMWSQLGLELGNAAAGRATRIISTSQKEHAEKISRAIGENDIIENKYNEFNVSCQSGALKYQLIVRVFDGSIAFRYRFPEQAAVKDLSFRKELTQFNLTGPFQIYQYHHESVFTPTRIDSLKTSSDFPSTITNGKVYMSIGEADNDNFTKAELGHGLVNNGLSVVFARDSTVSGNLPFQTPWRTVSFSNTAIGLHKFSELSLKLSPQPNQAVPSWIVPGKVIRSELNTQAALDCIELAKKMNFKYIMFDAGWYGPERSLSSDPSIPIAPIDMTKVILEGKKNGVGVILYVNYIGLKNHLDVILPLYQKWGVSGLKFGFIDGFSQKGISWLASAIKKVNDAGLFINIHDNYKPTGLSRTYPALLTQEGIRGDENSPDAFHTTVLPYTRFLAGAADFTFCFPNPKNTFSKNIKVSKAQQLALTVVYFSPLQSVFWYGKPKDYTNWDEIEFFKYVPTTWNESRYLKGEIGKNISVARRKDATWFIGNVAGFEDWTTEIKLDFLQAGKTYTATIYEDDEQGSIRKRTIEVKKGQQIPVILKAKGGQAIIISLL